MRKKSSILFGRRIHRHKSSTLWALKGFLRNEIMHLLTWRKILDVSACFFALVGLGVAMTESELYEEEVFSHIIYNNLKTNILKIETFHESTRLSFMRGFVTVTSVVLAILVYARSNVHSKLQDYYCELRGINRPKERFAGLKTLFITLLMLLHMPPRVNVSIVYSPLFIYVTLDTLITSVMTFRFLFPLYVNFNYSMWGNHVAQEACFRYNAKANWFFVFKCQSKEHPIITVGVLILLSAVWGGYLIQITERPYQYISGKDWDYIWNGMWCAIVTMTTVGYGDFTPKTLLGRIVTVLISIWGNFLTSIMVIALFKITRLDSKQNRALRKIKEKERKKQLISLAQSTIYHFMKYCFHFRSLKVYWRSKSYDLHYNLTSTCTNFANLRKKIISSAESLDYCVEHHAEIVETKMSKAWMSVKMAKYDLQMLFDQFKLNEVRQNQIDQLSLTLHDMCSRMHILTSHFQKLHGFDISSFGAYAHDFFAASVNFSERARNILDLENQDLQTLKALIQTAFRFNNNIKNLIVEHSENKEASQQRSTHKDTSASQDPNLFVKRSINRLSKTLDNLQAQKLLQMAKEKGYYKGEDGEDSKKSQTMLAIDSSPRRKDTRSNSIVGGPKGLSFRGAMGSGRTLGDLDSSRSFLQIPPINESSELSEETKKRKDTPKKLRGNPNHRHHSILSKSSDKKPSDKTDSQLSIDSESAREASIQAHDHLDHQS